MLTLTIITGPPPDDALSGAMTWAWSGTFGFVVLAILAVAGVRSAARCMTGRVDR